MMIKEWIFNIVTIVMIGVLVDIVLPNGNLKKYSQFMVGLITLIIILNPILNMFDQLPQLEKYIASNILDIDMKSFEYQNKVMTETQQYQLKELFQKNLESHISKEVQRITGYSDVKTQIEFNQTDIQGTEDIERIYVEIGLAEGGVKSIEPVDIYINASGSDIQGQTPTSDTLKMEQDEIVAHISNIYGIEPSKIYITWIDE